jgi:hypothetical protein
MKVTIVGAIRDRSSGDMGDLVVIFFPVIAGISL